MKNEDKKDTTSFYCSLVSIQVLRTFLWEISNNAIHFQSKKIVIGLLVGAQ
jgi:hypothetical protein